MNHQWQEIKIVSNPRPDPNPRRRVPPVLDVTLLELARRRPNDLRSRLRWSAIDEGHHILQLIAKPVRSAGLIKSGASPNAAGQDLIDKPAIEHEVDAQIGRCHMQGVQAVVPVLLHFGERSTGSIWLRVLLNEPMNLRETVRLTQDKNHFSRLTGRHRQFRPDCRTGIEGRGRAARQREAPHGRGR